MNIPDEVFDDPQYKRLRYMDKWLIVSLYKQYWDCEVFTINANDLQLFECKDSRLLYKRIRNLLETGFLRIVEFRKQNMDLQGRPYRVFEFKYKVTELED
jgi:hypothetical protein